MGELVGLALVVALVLGVGAELNGRRVSGVFRRLYVYWIDREPVEIQRVPFDYWPIPGREAPAGWREWCTQVKDATHTQAIPTFPDSGRHHIPEPSSAGTPIRRALGFLGRVS